MQGEDPPDTNYWGELGGGMPPTPWWAITDSGDSSNNAKFYNQDQGNKCLGNRQWDITTSDGGYTSHLDQLLDAYCYWDYADSTGGMGSPGYRYWCNRISEGMRTGPDFNHKDWYSWYGPITRIDWWWDAGALKGLEVFYGGASSGLVGIRVDDSSDSITLQDGEAITWFAFGTGDYVAKFAINTNLLMQQGQGQHGHGGPYDWQAGFNSSVPMADSDDRLAYFGGVCDGQTLSQLKLVFRQGGNYAAITPQEHRLDALP